MLHGLKSAYSSYIYFENFNQLKQSLLHGGFQQIGKNFTLYTT